MIKCDGEDFYPISVVDKNIDDIILHEDANIVAMNSSHTFDPHDDQKEEQEYDEIEQKLKMLHNEVNEIKNESVNQDETAAIGVNIRKGDDKSSLLDKNIEMLKSNNIVECCRSCGRTNVQLFELFGHNNKTNNNSRNNNNNNNNGVNSILTTNTSSNSDTPSKRHATVQHEYDEDDDDDDDEVEDEVSASHHGAVSSKKRKKINLNKGESAAAIASAKATAQGYSNMENIFQEMQLWQLRNKWVSQERLKIGRVVYNYSGVNHSSYTTPGIIKYHDWQQVVFGVAQWEVHSLSDELLSLSIKMC